MEVAIAAISLVQIMHADTDPKLESFRILLTRKRKSLQEPMLRGIQLLA